MSETDDERREGGDDQDEAPDGGAEDVAARTSAGFLALDGLPEEEPALPPPDTKTEPGFHALDGMEEEHEETEGAGSRQSDDAPCKPARARLSPMALLFVGVGVLFGVFATLAAQQLLCSGGQGPMQRGFQLPGAGPFAPGNPSPRPCPPVDEQVLSTLADPLRRGELEAIVVDARGRRITASSADAERVTDALFALGDLAAARIRPVTNLENVGDLGRSVSEPMGHFTRSADHYSRIVRFEPTLLQCAMLRMARASERLADSFDETAGAPALLAIDRSSHAASLRSIATTYRRVALQQYEMSLQVPIEDPQCTRVAQEGFQRLRLRLSTSQ